MLKPLKSRWRDTATLVTETPGMRNDAGRYVAGETVTRDIRCSAQPGRGDDYESSESGRRFENNLTLYAVESIPVNAVIRYKGVDYRVQRVERWQSHFKALALAAG